MSTEQEPRWSKYVINIPDDLELRHLVMESKGATDRYAHYDMPCQECYLVGTGAPGKYLLITDNHNYSMRPMKIIQQEAAGPQKEVVLAFQVNSVAPVVILHLRDVVVHPHPLQSPLPVKFLVDAPHIVRNPRRHPPSPETTLFVPTRRTDYTIREGRCMREKIEESNVEMVLGMFNVGRDVHKALISCLRAERGRDIDIYRTRVREPRSP